MNPTSRSHTVGHVHLKRQQDSPVAIEVDFGEILEKLRSDWFWGVIVQMIMG